MTKRNDKNDKKEWCYNKKEWRMGSDEDDPNSLELRISETLSATFTWLQPKIH